MNFYINHLEFWFSACQTITVIVEKVKKYAFNVAHILNSKQWNLSFILQGPMYRTFYGRKL
jgi:hypothetical protein